MNKIIALMLVIGSSLMLSACEEIPNVDTPALIEVEDTIVEYTETELMDTDNQDYGSTGALLATDYTLEDMLLYALQDEYAARAEYEYILETFDVTKPFSNIIKSEETHISMLLPLFETYGFDIPEDTSKDHLLPINSLEETFQIGVIAEINNIAMYNLFLENDELPSDVYDIFVQLRDASENHLAAFEKNAAKYE